MFRLVVSFIVLSSPPSALLTNLCFSQSASDTSSASSRDQLYHSANELLQSGRFEEAAAGYKNIIAKWPDFYQAYSLLGVAYTQMGKLQEAGSYFSKAVQLNPNSAEARNNLGANYLALKKFSQAAAEFRRVIALNPESVSAWYNLGTSELQAGQAGPAVTAFQRAAHLAPGDPQVRIGLAEAQFKVGNRKQALATIQEALGIAGSDAGVLLALGLVLERNGLSKEATRYFREALQQSSSTSERMMTLAGNSINQGEYKTALALLRALEGTMDNSAAWHGMLGYTHFKLDQVEPALTHLQRAIQLDPRNEDYYLDLGELLAENQALLPNVAVFESGVKRLPYSVKMRLALAVAHLLTGNLDRAKQEVNTVLAQDPGSEIAYKILLECYEKGREWDKVQIKAAELRRLHPANPLGWYYGAFAAYEAAILTQHGFSEAGDLIRKALELNPSEWRFHFLLGKILLAEQRVADAIGAFEKTIQLHSGHPQPFYHLARALQRQGRRRESAQMMARYREVKARMESQQSRGLLVDTR